MARDGKAVEGFSQCFLGALIDKRSTDVSVMTHRLAHLRSIFNGDGHLQQLLEHADSLVCLTRQVREMLPSGLSAHLSAAVGRDRVLVLYTDSPAWATRLRFAAPGLRAALSGFDDTQVRVVPGSSGPAPGTGSGSRKARLSRRAAEQIRVMAGTISDPELRQTLARLAERGLDETN
jgi:hypothetical protein